MNMFAAKGANAANTKLKQQMQIWSYRIDLLSQSLMHMSRFNFCLGSNFFQPAQLLIFFSQFLMKIMYYNY